MWQQRWRLEVVHTITAPENDSETVLPSHVLILLSNVYLNVILPSALSFPIRVDTHGHSSLTNSETDRQASSLYRVQTGTDFCV